MTTTSTATATLAQVNAPTMGAKTNLHQLEVHPSTQVLPEMDDDMYASLVADIHAHGVHQPIALFNGMIIDGRARYRACQELNLVPPVIEINATEAAPPDAVASMNLIRKHWTEGQRALLAARLTNTSLGSNQRQKDAVTQSAAAKRFAVSVDSLQRAKVVLKKNHEELTACVEWGLIPLTAAANAASYLTNDTIESLLESDELEVFASKVAAAVNAAKAKKVAANDPRMGDREKNEKKEPLEFALPIGKKKFSLIYANPPAQHDDLTLDEMSTMPVAELAEENALLFLWTTNSKLERSLKLMSAWGFKYKTNFSWDKQLNGGGVFHNGRHALLLVGVRGAHTPIHEGVERPHSVLREKPANGCTKPIEAYVMLETMYPDLSKIELFCEGKPRAGWARWKYEKPAAKPASSHVAAAATVSSSTESTTVSAYDDVELQAA